ncbi:DUF2911 domain-containing protein [Algivirga pacifica]|uniref:DUF2911 domain-containing protein n=1 Tax=Algivirga pacifica TaxID=1162670 RepID=A0ABP9D582_9BACT
MMNKFMTRTLLVVAAMLFNFSAFAQQLPVPSPAASVKQQVGLTDISIDYSSPAVKGRKVFGELQPYGVTWRAGANGATKITFSTDVTINGTALKAGDYSLFLTPYADKAWTFHFNGEGKSIFDYKAGQDVEAIKADDVVRVEAKPMEAPMKERLTYLVEATTDNKATVSLWWEKTMISFEVEVPTETLATANVEAELKQLDRAWRTYQNIAGYYVSANNTAKAMEMIDKSIEVKPEYFWNTWTKAQILAQDGEYKKAVKLAEKAKAFGEKNPDGAFNYFNGQGMIDKDINTWKASAKK